MRNRRSPITLLGRLDHRTEDSAHLAVLGVNRAVRRRSTPPRDSPERGGMFGGTENRSILVVIKKRQLRSPPKDDRKRAVEASTDRSQQRLRPPFHWAQGSLGPIECAHALRHLAVALKHAFQRRCRRAPQADGRMASANSFGGFFTTRPASSGPGSRSVAVCTPGMWKVIASRLRATCARPRPSHCRVRRRGARGAARFNGIRDVTGTRIAA